MLRGRRTGHSSYFRPPTFTITLKDSNLRYLDSHYPDILRRALHILPNSPTRFLFSSAIYFRLQIQGCSTKSFERATGFVEPSKACQQGRLSLHRRNHHCRQSLSHSRKTYYRIRWRISMMSSWPWPVPMRMSQETRVGRRPCPPSPRIGLGQREVQEGGRQAREARNVQEGAMILMMRMEETWRRAKRKSYFDVFDCVNLWLHSPVFLPRLPFALTSSKVFPLPLHHTLKTLPTGATL